MCTAKSDAEKSRRRPSEVLRPLILRVKASTAKRSADLGRQYKSYISLECIWHHLTVSDEDFGSMWDQGLHSRSSHMVSERTWTDFAASYGKHSNLHTGIVQNLNAQIGMDCLQLLASSGTARPRFLIIYDNTTCFICKCTSESRWEQPSNRPALVNIKDRHAAWVLSEVVFLVQGIREEGIKPNAKGCGSNLISPNFAAWWDGHDSGCFSMAADRLLAHPSGTKWLESFRI